MRVFEYVRNGHRFGLAPTREDAARHIGTDALSLYEIREIDIPVVYLLINDPDGFDYDVVTGTAYTTYEKAIAAREKNQGIAIAELV